jgi:hypothetical protein
MGILWGWSMLTEMLFVARSDFSSAFCLHWCFYCGWLATYWGSTVGLTARPSRTRRSAGDQPLEPENLIQFNGLGVG